MPARRPTALAVAAGTCVTVALTGLLLWPAVGRGQLLYRDFVSVPEPSLTARTLGLDGPAPRAVPLDLVIALLHPVVPSGLQQLVLLAATLLLAGVGVTVLLRRWGPVATVVGAALATWSPYAVERLLLGQPPTLLAVSTLPWIVVVAREAATRRRWLVLTVVAALPAALTPVGGLTAAAAALVAAVAFRRAPVRDLAAVAALNLLWCSPWLVAVLAGHTDVGQSDGAQAFAVRAAGVHGVIDVLTGGGVWSEAATPASRLRWWPLVVGCLTFSLAVVGAAGLRRQRRLGFACLVAPPVVALVLATPTGIAVLAAAQSVPGVALVRDTHRWVGISAMTVAVLAPLGLLGLLATLPRTRTRTRTRPRASDRGPSRRLGAVVALAAAAVGVSLAVLAVPDAAARLHAAYRPVTFPSSWERVVAAVGERSALVLPWQPMRSVGWAGAEPFLDPLPLALRGPVTVARDLLVDRDGRLLRVGGADPQESASWAQGVIDADQLRRQGIELVVEWQGTPGRLPVRPDGLVEVLRDDEFVVWSVRD
ncbi:hypothetical protein FHX52_1240 [Humibacillus xanthopallidus]|uniref:Glycosyltransferase RgtA/B/C/D-like domain-containing protein n=2 Tax=Humibacillus xanthopallidus TaxID=412689 RepID=A0A543PVN8_9MICO|nr:hypothetical protein FHX52_1240 [Humibacillus xanthopallidus]